MLKGPPHWAIEGEDGARGMGGATRKQTQTQTKGKEKKKEKEQRGSHTLLLLIVVLTRAAGPVQYESRRSGCVCERQKQTFACIGEQHSSHVASSFC